MGAGIGITHCRQHHKCPSSNGNELLVLHNRQQNGKQVSHNTQWNEEKQLSRCESKLQNLEQRIKEKKEKKVRMKEKSRIKLS